MERVVKTKFWHFHQNNSGGYYVKNDEHGVSQLVIIEAQTFEEAWSRLETVGDNVEGFWNFCGRCGERWDNWLDDDDGTEIPMNYDTPLEEIKEGRNKAFVHYYDRSIKEFKFT